VYVSEPCLLLHVNMCYVALSLCHHVTLSPYHLVVMSPCHVSTCHVVTMLAVTISPCHQALVTNARKRCHDVYHSCRTFFSGHNVLVDLHFVFEMVNIGTDKLDFSVKFFVLPELRFKHICDSRTGITILKQLPVRFLFILHDTSHL